MAGLSTPGLHTSLDHSQPSSNHCSSAAESSHLYLVALVHAYKHITVYSVETRVQALALSPCGGDLQGWWVTLYMAGQGRLGWAVQNH